MQDLRCAHAVTRFCQDMRAAPARCASGHFINIHSRKLSPISRGQAALAIAKAFSAGAPDRSNMIAFAARQIDAAPGLLSTLAADTLAILGTRIVVTHYRKIASLLRDHPALVVAFGRFGAVADEEEHAIAAPSAKQPMRNSFVAAPTTTRPPFWPLSAYNLPVIDSTADLCTLLEIHPQRLEAWTRRWRQRSSQAVDLQQRISAYFTYWQPKKRGGARLIEIPKPDLKQAQRRLLKRVIERVDPHEAATGFRRGYSLIDHVSRHVGQELVLKCDLQDFFAAVRASRIHSIFRHMGYNETVASALSMIVTSRASAKHALDGRHYGVDLHSAKRYQSDHLPQGAPTSPALANLAAFKLDLRLASLAESANVSYSRYADDLTFSGARRSGLSTERLYLHICAIAMDEGFNINTRKTRLMTQNQCQLITGLVVNERPNVDRREYDRLKATLTNAVRHGLESQNLEQREYFRSHLLGKIAFFAQVNPLRGDKLRQLWTRVEI